MGTDIHMWVEIKEKRRWHLAEVSVPCEFCGGTGGKQRGDDPCWWCGGTAVGKQFSDRNYDLFGMLASVRNGVGFAGCDRGDGFLPIGKWLGESGLRGWPRDMSAALREHFKRCGLEEFGEATAEEIDHYEEERCLRGPRSHLPAWPGDHSASYYTVAEIDRYFAAMGAANTKQRALIPIGDVPGFVAQGHPPGSYCGDIMGEGVKKIDLTQAQELLAKRPALARQTGLLGGVEGGTRYYVRVEWPERYLDAAGESFRVWLAACRALKPKAEHVRLVFNFDS